MTRVRGSRLEPGPQESRLLTRHEGWGLTYGPPATASIVVAWMVLVGILDGGDLLDSGALLWQPLLTIASIMVMAGAAQRLGLLDGMAAMLVPRARGSAHRLFALTFGLSALTSALLNNDSAVLLLTPAMVLLARRAYPQARGPSIPFVFAVFMAAGVAPMVVSNPMNMIVAEFAGIGFNSYLVRMLPVSLVGWVVAYGLLWLVFRRRLDELGAPDPGGTTELAIHRPTHAYRALVALLVLVLVGYSVVTFLGGPLWAVAAVGAVLTASLAVRSGGHPVRVVAREDVAWDTLVFLAAVVVASIGFRNAGVVDHLVALYRDAGTATIGVVSAVGSALINNHPMGHLNMLAIDELPAAGEAQYLAALVGGDLGPRLLPVGSLAGLLWFASLRRMDVHVGLGRFCLIGALLTVVTLPLSLAVLSLLT